MATPDAELRHGADYSTANALRSRLTPGPAGRGTSPPKRPSILLFAVRHYAGEVIYEASGFREKNEDSLHPDLSAVMQESHSPFVRHAGLALDVVSTILPVPERLKEHVEESYLCFVLQPVLVHFQRYHIFCHSAAVGDRLTKYAKRL